MPSRFFVSKLEEKKIWIFHFYAENKIYSRHPYSIDPTSWVTKKVQIRKHKKQSLYNTWIPCYIQLCRTYILKVRNLNKNLVAAFEKESERIQRIKQTIQRVTQNSNTSLFWSRARNQIKDEKILMNQLKTSKSKSNKTRESTITRTKW